jgi:hypothetical protein
MTAFILLSAAGLATAIVYARFYVKRKRTEALRRVAKTFGFAWSPRDIGGLLRYDFDLLFRGDGRGSENSLRGSFKGVSFRAADYWYYTSEEGATRGRGRTYHYFSAAVVDIPAYLPDLKIEPEGLVSRVAGSLGFKDIDFESQEFNLRYKVSAPERSFAYKLIDPRMMQWLLSVPAGCSFEFRGPAALVYCNRLPAEKMISLIGTAVELCSRLPELVLTEYGNEAVGTEF